MKRALKPSTTTLIKSLALALALPCVVSADGFAGEDLYYRPQPIVVARGSAHAIGRLGFRYENGFGVPQNYIAAADLYLRAAEQGDPFAQSRLGLSYDKGHGVPLDYILAYKWLDLAAARASGRDRTFYLKLRDAVASKMSLAQVMEGQRLALLWAANRAAAPY
ncbi:MAG TPA: tetratricopeptide repeat protein [Bradyrhizobium sp.]|uniref:tetratricopeptide repeat protein n=1 Tax=Bradyrhizobium sp. TaxID=376 RepID=UPI002D811536|nr:tetratricopeptide repeat protein [Bradyrhizobium sp.]HET7889387.1 tetratricopeptide repeat protein [Bradyrhizobium sp.]